MVQRRVGLAACVLSLFATACRVDVDYAGTEFQCDATGACPSGYECRGGTCVPDTAPDEDAGIDAGTTAIDGGAPDGGAPDGGVPLVCGTAAKLVDDFDDGVIGPLWGDGFSDTGTELIELDGQLVLRVTADAGDVWVGTFSRYPHDLAGNHAQVRVDQVGPQYTVLEVRRPDGARAQLVENGGVIKAAVYGLPSGNGVRAELPYDAGTHRWWRIREQDGVLHWESSADGAAWTSLHQESNPFPPQMLQLLLGAGGSQAVDTEARFDDFNPDGDPAQPWCPLTDLQDDFDDGALSAAWDYSWDSTGCALAETDGAATIQFDGTANSWCWYQSWPVFDACNSAAAVEVAAPLDVANAEMWLDIYLPDGRVAVQLWGGLLRLVAYAGTELTMSETVAFETTAHRWWRIRTDGTSAHWETSPNGVGWTTHVSRAITLDCSAASVGIGAGVWDTWSGGPIEARFDNVNVVP